MKSLCRKINFIVSIIVSIILIVIVNIFTSYFTFMGFFFSILITFLLSLIMGLLIPFDKFINKVCDKFKLKENSLRIKILDSLIISLTYTIIISFILVLTIVICSGKSINSKQKKYTENMNSYDKELISIKKDISNNEQLLTELNVRINEAQINRKKPSNDDIQLAQETGSKLSTLKAKAISLTEKISKENNNIILLENKRPSFWNLFGKTILFGLIINFVMTIIFKSIYLKISNK